MLMLNTERIQGEVLVEGTVKCPEPLSRDSKHLCQVLGPHGAEFENLQAGLTMKTQLWSAGKVYLGH